MKCLIVLSLVATLCATHARSTSQVDAGRGTQQPAFDIISIKPSDPNPSGSVPPIRTVRMPINGRFIATYAPLRTLIMNAYSLRDYQVIGGPAWQVSKKFD